MNARSPIHSQPHTLRLHQEGIQHLKISALNCSWEQIPQEQLLLFESFIWKEQPIRKSWLKKGGTTRGAVPKQILNKKHNCLPLSRRSAGGLGTASEPERWLLCWGSEPPGGRCPTAAAGTSVKQQQHGFLYITNKKSLPDKLAYISNSVPFHLIGLSWQVGSQRFRLQHELLTRLLCSSLKADVCLTVSCLPTWTWELVSPVQMTPCHSP